MPWLLLRIVHAFYVCACFVVYCSALARYPDHETGRADAGAQERDREADGGEKREQQEGHRVRGERGGEGEPCRMIVPATCMAAFESMR